ncbi:ABC transporter permease [uncultured Desulfobacter sp.]|uniref:ABC transporter permease n=1 Tax=uncultured Desulfobacter sp. TaxID=240139 RepID=UPI0029C836D4|nr:ABC transporter permease [uncultured Desulfobacter sp.]
MKALSFDLIISLIAGLFVCLVVFPMVALFTTTSVAELANQFRSSGVLSAVIISFQTSVIVVLLACCLGIPVAYVLAMKDFKGKDVLDTLVDLPIAVPPLVAGLALLILLGGSSPLGGMLSHHGIEIIFSKKGIIVAQLFVSSPFLIKSAREAFESINKNVTHASWVLGASKFYTFRKVMLPLAKNGIYAGMVMTWARALGEFGATSMVAGCIPFKTETMTVAIYQNAMSGELKASIAIALLLTVFSFTLLLIFKSRARRRDVL